MFKSFVYLANILFAYVGSSWNFFCQELTAVNWNFIECTWLLSRMMLRKKRRVYNCQFPPQLLEVVSQSEVFLYPLLLPPQPFRFDGFAKPFYFPSEDMWVNTQLTFSNPIFLPPAYSPALIYFGQERGWWITCNYPTALKEKNRNRKSTTCAICWLKSVLHEENRRTGSDSRAGEQMQQKKCRMSSDIGAEQENHSVRQVPT
jgi:hypothetical protein